MTDSQMDTRSGRKVEPPPPGRAPPSRKPPEFSKPATRAATPVADLEYSLDVTFPMFSMFGPSNKLPTLASTVMLLRHYSSQRKTRKGVGSDQASREVAKIIMAKWYYDTLPCIGFESLVYQLVKLYQEVLTGSRDMRRTDGKKRKSVERYKELVAEKDKLYDISEENETKRRRRSRSGGDHGQAGGNLPGRHDE